MRRTIELALGPVVLLLVAAVLGSLVVFAIAVGLALTYGGLLHAVTKARERLVVVRRVDRDEVMEGHPVTLEYEVGGLDRLPVSVELLCRCGRWHRLTQGVNTVSWAIDQPGLHAITPSPLRIRDDLGIYTRVLYVGHADDQVLVLPVPAPTHNRPRRGAATSPTDPEPDGLRTYVRGTPMSRIHWKSAARGAELQERVFAPATDDLPLVLVDTAGEPSPAAVDWAARTAAGHVQALARMGGCRLLLPGDRTPILLMDPVAHWPAVHRRLATLGRGAPSSASVHDLRSAVRVTAVTAPPNELHVRRPLPPGVVALGEWTGA